MTNPDLAFFAIELIEWLQRISKRRHTPIQGGGAVIEIPAAELDRMLKAAATARDRSSS